MQFTSIIDDPAHPGLLLYARPRSAALRAALTRRGAPADGVPVLKVPI
jgi:hypothetical protein